MSFHRGQEKVERGKYKRFGWLALPGSPLLPSGEGAFKDFREISQFLMHFLTIAL
jgi:hypothetical protein